MDNIRLILLLALGFISLQIWQAWQNDYVLPKQQAQQLAAQQAEGMSGNGKASDASVPTIATDKGQAATLPATPVAGHAAKAQGHSLIHVRTDTLDLEIDPVGGSIVEARLNKYPVSLNTPDIKFQLLTRQPDDFFIAQSGLIASNKGEGPDHTEMFSSPSTDYVMGKNQDKLTVDLTWTSPAGVKVVKRYIFTRGAYAVKMQYLVENGSNKPWTGREYSQLQRGKPTAGGSLLMHTYTGGAAYSPQNNYRKFDFDQLNKGEPNENVTDGWVAMIQHYFLAAIIPPRNQPEHFYGRQLPNGRAVIGTYTKPLTIEPGKQGEFTSTWFIGPKLQKLLEKTASGLDLTVDYGWLVFIARPMHLVLQWIDKYVGNWGWTIIIFTILIKLVFYKLSETSYRSMANMRKLAPRIQALKDRYGDDKQRMQQAMMEMYKKDKINPLGGCLPMLVQIPFFISLYWVLLESVELRQAPWILWIHDLSVPDPYFILPTIMAVSMFLQQKLNPAPPDPMQAKIMSLLPLVFGVMFAFFPAGLVLYWVTNNILSITQQYVITRRIEAGDKS